MLKRSGKILLEGTLEEFKNYPKGAEGREYVLMNIDEKGPDGSYAFYEKDDKGDIIPVSFKGAEGYDGIEVILFADPEFERIMLANFNTNGKGGINIREAEAITDIGQLFKGNTALVTTEDLALLKNVKTLPATAFLGCSNLKTVVIPKQVNSIEPDCFGNTNLSSIKIYGDAQLTGASASFGTCTVGSVYFYGTKTLNMGLNGKVAASNVYIGNSVTTISNDTCYQFRGLSSINIPNSVTKIGNKAFSLAGLTSVTIPNSVTEIGELAFAGCTLLESATLSEGLISIGPSAFASCNLQSITVPNSVTTILGSAFKSNTLLNSAVLPNNITLISNSLFYNCSNLHSITIPSSVTSIDETAFFDCSNLSSITIPNSVTSIGTSAFNGCTGLTLILIPNSVTSIGLGAFYGCSSLTSITIPNSITEIAPFLFYNCTNLASIEIPSNITTIGGLAFKGCSNLAYIKCYRETPALIVTIPYGSPFSEITYSCTLYVPINSLEAYQTANGWKDFLNIIGFDPEEETQE